MLRYVLLLVGAVMLAGCPSGESSAAQDPAPPPPAPKAPTDHLLHAEVKDVPRLSGPCWPGCLIPLPPGTKVTLKPCAQWRLSLSDDSTAKWKAAGGSAVAGDAGSLELFTPQLQGASYTLQATRGETCEQVRLEILHEAALARSARTGAWTLKLKGKRLGTYPDPGRARSWRVRMHKDLYAPPRFWMKITPANQDLLLAPHLAVGQMVGFVTQKDKSKPKHRHTDWFPPNRALVNKLELLTRELLAAGVKLKRLAVNSGFRSPYYNRKIGGSSFSRHIYGDAADVMVDEDGDEVCDDINGDGAQDEKDGLVIGQSARRLEASKAVALGGLGVYGMDGKDSCRSYCHLDSRGYLTRWGTVYRRGRRRLLEWWPASEYREDEPPPPEFRDPPGGNKPKAPAK
jgi:hypothetical protein